MGNQLGRYLKWPDNTLSNLSLPLFRQDTLGDVNPLRCTEQQVQQVQQVQQEQQVQQVQQVQQEQQVQQQEIKEEQVSLFDIAVSIPENSFEPETPQHERVVAFQMTFIDRLIKDFQQQSEYLIDSSPEVRILLFGNLYLPSQSCLDMGRHHIYDEMVERIQATHLGNMSGKVCLGTIVRHTIDLIKVDKQSRILTIYLNNWVYRGNKVIGLSDHEYDLFQAILEAYNVALYIIFKIPPHLQKNYFILKNELSNQMPEKKLNIEYQLLWEKNLPNKSQAYFDWWMSQTKKDKDTTNVVRPRLCNPYLLNQETSICGLCQKKAAVKSLPCFHMFCQQCLISRADNSQKNACPICYPAKKEMST